MIQPSSRFTVPQRHREVLPASEVATLSVSGAPRQTATGSGCCDIVNPPPSVTSAVWLSTDDPHQWMTVHREVPCALACKLVSISIRISVDAAAGNAGGLDTHTKQGNSVKGHFDPTAKTQVL